MLISTCCDEDLDLFPLLSACHSKKIEEVWSALHEEYKKDGSLIEVYEISNGNFDVKIPAAGGPKKVH